MLASTLGASLWLADPGRVPRQTRWLARRSGSWLAVGVVREAAFDET